MTFGKVLSPQYFIWILPAWALVAARDRWLAVLGGLTLALTQAEFPALYWNLLDMQPAPLAIVVARNTLLLVTFVVALWRVWRLPGGRGRGSWWSRRGGAREPTVEGHGRCIGAAGARSCCARRRRFAKERS